MNNPMQILINELKGAMSVCDNEERKWVYQNVIDRAEKLLEDQTKLLKGVYLDGRMAELIAITDDTKALSAEEYIKNKIDTLCTE